MGVNIQRDPHIGVAHHILQILDIHTRIGHVSAKGMAEHMGRNVRQRLVRMQLAILLHGPAHLILDVQRHFGLVVLVQQQKSGVSVYDHLCFECLATSQDIFKALVHRIRHGNKPATRFGFCFLHIVFAAPLPDELVIHPDTPVLKIQITFGQAAELAHSHPGFQQDYKLVVILAVGLVTPDKAHPDFLLLLGHGDSLLRVIGNDLHQLEVEGILSDDTGVDAVEDPDGAINSGKLILINDGRQVKLGRAVTSKATVADDEAQALKKIKMVAAVDLIRYYALTTIEDNYQGKCSNTYDNKCILLTALRGYLKELENGGVLLEKSSGAELDAAAIRAFLIDQASKAGDVEETNRIKALDDAAVVKEDTGSYVFIRLFGYVLDAMEDFAVTLEVSNGLLAM